MSATTGAHKAVVGQTTAAVGLFVASFLALPLAICKLAKFDCANRVTSTHPYLSAYPCQGQPRDVATYLARHYFKLLSDVLLVRWNRLHGPDGWLVFQAWFQLLMLLAVSGASHKAYIGILLPPFVAVMTTAWVCPIHFIYGLGGWEPSPFTWQHIQMAVMYRSLSVVALSTTPLIDSVATGVICVLSLATCLVIHQHHPHLEFDLRLQLLYVATAAAATVATHTWLYGASRRAATSVGGRALLAAAALVKAPAADDDSHDVDVKGQPAYPKPRLSACVVRTACQLGALPARKGRPPPSYVPFCRMASVRLKLEGVEPHMLPRGWEESFGEEAGAQLGGVSQAVYVRAGCIELVADVALWPGVEEHAGGRARNGIRLPLDAQALAASLRLAQQPTSVVAVALTGGRPLSEAPLQPGQASPKLRIEHLRPRVALLQQAAACASPCARADWDEGHALPKSTQFWLTVSGTLLQGAAQQQQGVGFRSGPERTAASAGRDTELPPLELTLRAHGAYLHATSLRMCEGSSGSADGFADGGSGSGLEFQLRLNGLPPGPGLLLADCRCGRAVSPMVPVLLVEDAAVALELQQAAAYYSTQQLDQLLFDLGLWLEYVRAPAEAQWPQHHPLAAAAHTAMQAAQTAGQRSPAARNTVHTQGVGSRHSTVSGCGGSARASPEGPELVRLGAHLLQHACKEGWPHTTRWLLADLLALGVRYRDLAPGRLLPRGSPGLLLSAGNSQHPALWYRVLLWSMCTWTRPAPAGHRNRWHLRVGGGSAVVTLRKGLLQALGSACACAHDEAVYQELLQRYKVSNAAVMSYVDTLCFATMLGRSGNLWALSNMSALIACGPGALLALAGLALRDRARHQRLLVAATPVHYLCYAATQALILLLRLPVPAGIHAYHSSIAVWATEAVLIPASRLVSLPAAVLLVLVKAPVQTGMYMQACAIPDSGCSSDPWVAALHAVGLASLSVFTTLACHTGLWLRAMGAQHRAKAA